MNEAIPFVVIGCCLLIAKTLGLFDGIFDSLGGFKKNRSKKTKIVELKGHTKLFATLGLIKVKKTEKIIQKEPGEYLKKINHEPTTEELESKISELETHLADLKSKVNEKSG